MPRLNGRIALGELALRSVDAPPAEQLSPSTRRMTASSGIAQPRGILRDHIQHRLNIRRRAGDDTQDFTRRRLLLQRLLEFLEQPHVLDGDHGLVGEGFKELDLRRGEGAHLDATCGQHSNEFPLLTKRSGQEGAPVAGRTQHWEIVLRADVGNVERAVLAHPAILWLINTDLDAVEWVWDQNEPAEP